MEYPGLVGKNVLLVAGHSHLGQHVTDLFARSGANVFIAARDSEQAERVAGRMRAYGRGTVRVVPLDAFSEDSLSAAIRVTRELGNIDVYYHGIGWNSPSDFLTSAPPLWDQLYEANFRSAAIAYRLIIPIMIDQGNGCIIAMGSVAGRRPAAGSELYGAFKCALTHLSQALALRVAPFGVRINVVSPGPTPPADGSQISANSSFREFTGDHYKERLAQLAQQIPLGILGDPLSVAHAVLFLASPETGKYHTGQVIGVDGGMYMPR